MSGFILDRYTLVKDDMKTLKYILGSLDDILEFYSSFPNMNLSPSEKGLKINENKTLGLIKTTLKNIDWVVENLYFPGFILLPDLYL